MRQVLLEQGVDLYNGQAKVINCRAIGTCGTCAVQIDAVTDAVTDAVDELRGEESVVSEATWRERGTGEAIAAPAQVGAKSSFGLSG
ncbi:MAG: hypothetical protein MUF49_22295 [Oculatellaceae cyanobacterium Prado106]|nr:hypothetical protein [Oculatellaceae cyanobacterium Prado106]